MSEPKIFLCPICPGRKKLLGYANWRVHVAQFHEGADPRLPSSVNKGIKAVDSYARSEGFEITCTWEGCAKLFTSVDSFYTHTHVTHKVDYPHAKEAVPGPLQDDLDDALHHWLFLSDSYRDYCRERGIEP